MQIYSLSLVLLALPIVGFRTIQNPCECDAQFLGEDTTNGDPLSNLHPEAGFTMSGTASFVDRGSLPGHCNTGDQPCLTENNCIFDFSVKVDITGVTGGVPDTFKIGPNVYDLTPSGTPGYYSGSTPSQRYDGLSCGEFKWFTIKVLDDSSAKMSTAKLMLDCDPCSASL